MPQIAAKTRQSKPPGRVPYTPAPVRKRVLARHISGQSNRCIAITEGIDRGTVSRILTQREVVQKIARYQSRVLDMVPDAAGTSHALDLRRVDPGSFAGSRAQRREDIMFFLAMLRLQGLKPPPVTALPSAIRTDIKKIWPNYAGAQAEGDRFLFRMGDPTAIKTAAMGLAFGKVVSDDLYVHRSAQDDLPALLRLIIFAGTQIVGDVGYNVVKIRLDGRAISFLEYAEFDENPHPCLLHSVRAYLPKASYDIRHYTDSKNPPILHRKDTLVSANYALHERFRALTQAEDAAGLLSHPDIGYLEGWLRTKGIRPLGVQVQDGALDHV